MLKRILKVLFIGFIVFVFVISSYELFFHKAEAAWLTCDWNAPCLNNGDSCSQSITCTCRTIVGGTPQCTVGGTSEQ